MQEDGRNLVPGVIKPVLLGITSLIFAAIVGIVGYWAGYITEGAQRAATNEVRIITLSKDVDLIKIDLKSDMRDIKARLDKINDAITQIYTQTKP